MGRWIKTTNPHVCRRPTSTRRRGVGSEWRCRCGQVWRITRKSTSPDGAFETTAWAPINPPATTDGGAS